jgi:D-glycerate 3-kinase
MSSAIERLIADEHLPSDYRQTVDAYWRGLSEEIAMRAMVGPVVVGINGAQGSGKTTLCKFLEVLLVEHNQRAATLSIDDLYLTRAERQRLAREVHPLLATRGVPGTHDTALGLALIEDFRAGRDLDLPRFDKSVDDRAPEPERVEGPLQVLLFEGWCLGAAPQDEAALAEPVNPLEAAEDADLVWLRRLPGDETWSDASLVQRANSHGGDAGRRLHHLRLGRVPAPTSRAGRPVRQQPHQPGALQSSRRQDRGPVANHYRSVRRNHL